MRGDEIHDAERQAFDLRQGGDGIRVMQRAMRFDQNMQRQVGAASRAGVAIEHSQRKCDIL
jgi:hypothetical protein